MLLRNKIDTLLFQEDNEIILETLSLFRIFLCITCIVFIIFEFNSTFYTKHSIILNQSICVIIYSKYFIALKCLCIFSGILFAIGIDILLVKILFLISFFQINLHSYLITNNFNYNTHLLFFLLLLTFSNSSTYYTLFNKNIGQRIMIPTLYDRYCIGFVKLYIGILYFQTFLSKLIVSGIAWFATGDTLKTVILLRGSEFSKVFLNYPFMFKFFSILTGIFELSFLIILVCTRKEKMIGIIAILFHLSVFCMMKISFWFLWILFIPIFIIPNTNIKKYKKQSKLL